MRKYKEEYDKQVQNSATQINYNEEMRKHTKKNSTGRIYWSGCKNSEKHFLNLKERVNFMGAGSRGRV